MQLDRTTSRLSPRQSTVERICKQCRRAFKVFASDGRSGHGVFCSIECRVEFKALTPERFRLRLIPEGECEVWTGSRTPEGYGMVRFHGKGTPCHRVAYTFAFGPIPAGLSVLHRCDNPPCCRPEHLFLGTHRDNMLDMVRKGRHISQVHPELVARGDRNGSRTHPERIARGERSGPSMHPERMARGESKKCSRLTDVNVAIIRHRYAEGKISVRKLAAEFGVSFATCYNAIWRKTWKHVP